MEVDEKTQNRRDFFKLFLFSWVFVFMGYSLCMLVDIVGYLPNVYTLKAL